MAIQAPYKKFKRGQRTANVETDFRSGMMYTEGTVSEGYVKTLVNFDFTTDGKDALKPRAALVTNEIILPFMLADWDPETTDKEEFLDDNVAIKYAKECVENGRDYRQIILGKPDVIGGEPDTTGKIWAVTAERNLDDFEDMRLAKSDLVTTPETCAFYNTGLTEVHKCRLISDAKTSFPVGTFMGNSFYFFDAPSGGDLRRTIFDAVDPDDPDAAQIGGKYNFEDVTVKTLTASEAVNYGYNMLDDNPYQFNDGSTAASFQMTGILPYDAASAGNLIMHPKANTRVWFRCNYNAPAGYTYKIVWSFKELTADEWTVFGKNNSFNSTGTPVLQAYLNPPTKEILVRCEAYRIENGVASDAVETAMTVGFDFTLDKDDTALGVPPAPYDLSTCTGMISWKNRLILWGLPKDPTILFISDLEEPGYFPYPNNITVFDEPVIAVTELMDNLVVFTKTKVHQVAMNADGNSWTSTVIQSNLYIEPWDKHLIQSVRNMVYFKSGNYYYMIVPKAQSTTGELTLAPITTPITDFFNHFEHNVIELCKACFKHTHEDGELHLPYPEQMLTYYNFIDYENVHNFYVYKYQENEESDIVYVHFDIIYNTVNRYWKINVYEAPHFLFPFRNDATQQGQLASTSVLDVYNADTSEQTVERFIQLYKYDPLQVEDLYIPEGTDVLYSAAYLDSIVVDGVLTPVEGLFTVEDEVLNADEDFVRLVELPKEIFEILSTFDFVGGFNRRLMKDTLLEVKDALRAATVFSNKQMLDTGYRDANIFVNKRYRELQLQINNIDNVDMEFGMDFKIAGEPRNTDFLYEVSQVIDEMREDEGIVYLDATPYIPIDSEKIDKVNLWTIRHSLDFDVSLWKVRAAVSGKGMAPRLRLFTKDMFNYQLLGINWIYREMNMR